MLQNIIKGTNIEQLISLNFWFRNPGAASLEEFIFILAASTIITLLGVLVLVYNRRVVGTYPPKNKILKLGGIGLVGFGFSGAVFSLFRWQGIDFLGVRFILLVIFLTGVAWAIILLYLYRKNVPDQVVRYEANLIKRKYLSR